MKKVLKKALCLILCISFLCGGCVFLPLNTAAIGANEAKIADFLKNQMGLNTAAVCGILANIEWESGFDPTILGDNGTSYGICQWHNSRWDALKDYCNKKGYDWRGLDGQLWYLKYELESSGASILKYIKGVTNNADGAYDAAYHWCYYFERPADTANMSVKRGNLAKSKYWPLYSNSYSTVSEGVYRLKNKATGKYLSVKDSGDANGQNIELTSSAGNSTVFIIKKVYGTVYSIKADCSKAGRMVNVYASTVESGKNVTLYDCTDDVSQQWFFQSATGGYVVRSAANISCVLDTDSSNVCVKTYTGASNQIWELVNISTYTVSYDANGGTGAPAAQKKSHGTALKLSTAVPKLPGYVFLGWASSPDAVTAEYKAGASFSYNGDITLYAVWQIEPCEGEGGTGHKWTLTAITGAPTCTARGKGDYFCSKCGKTVEMELLDADVVTEWMTDPLSFMPESAAQTKTIYRYSTGDTEDELRETGRGTVLTAEFPEGFDTTNKLYTDYNVKTEDTETENTARRYSSEKTVAGYIYWHWCRSAYNYVTTPTNLYIDTHSSAEYDTFHAFYSETYYEYDPVKDGTKIENAEACHTTYWWQEPITVYACDYTDYEKVQVTSFGEWQDEPLPDAGDRICETGTLYRYDLKPLGHDYGKTVVAPTCISDGYTTYTCAVCSDSYVGDPKPTAGHSYIEEKVSPTCTGEGFTLHVCTACGDNFKDNFVSPTGHSVKLCEIVSAPTCLENAVGLYRCERCGTYTENAVLADGETETDWLPDKLSAVPDEFYETKTQYKYVSDGSYAVSGEGTVEYASFPSGFDTGNSLYKKYNVSVSDTKTRKYSDDKTVVGYIYWHWCSSSYTGSTPGNLLISRTRTSAGDGTRAYDVFHAFYTTTYTPFDTSKDAAKVVNAAACPHVYWWQEPIPVYRVSYKDYAPTEIHTEWQDEPLPEKEGFTVETRTLYKYDLSAHGHVYYRGVCRYCGEENPDYVMPGDLNFDKKVNVQDLNLMKLLLTAALTDPALTVPADINCDGKLNAIDANSLKKIIIGVLEID